MELEFLGTGTSQGVPVINCDCKVCRSSDARDKRLRCSVLVRTGTETILVDGGPDMRHQLLRTTVPDLDAVLLTHEHMDHVAGLDDLRSFNYRQKRAMPIYADKRTQDAVKRVFSYAFAEKRYPGIPQFELELIDGAPFQIGKTEVVPIEVLHYKLPVWGFRFGDITYITDAKSIASSEKEKIKGSRIVILNALRKEEHLSHFNLDQAIALIKELAPEQAYFTHISHLMGTFEDVAAELPDGINLAYDGLVIR